MEGFEFVIVFGGNSGRGSSVRGRVGFMVGDSRFWVGVGVFTEVRGFLEVGYSG